MKKMKYIMVDECLPIIFGEYFKHDKVARGHNVTSAGFVEINFAEKTVSVYGESLSLKKKSDPGDEGIIHNLFFPYSYI